MDEQREKKAIARQQQLDEEQAIEKKLEREREEIKMREQADKQK